MKYVFNICEANISQRSYFTLRSNISHAERRISLKKALAIASAFSGDPNGIRTHVTAVKGRCLNRLTIGPSLIFHWSLSTDLLIIPQLIQFVKHFFKFFSYIIIYPSIPQKHCSYKQNHPYHI